jgi:hypothetical protein
MYDQGTHRGCIVMNTRAHRSIVLRAGLGLTVCTYRRRGCEYNTSYARQAITSSAARPKTLAQRVNNRGTGTRGKAKPNFESAHRQSSRAIPHGQFRRQRLVFPFPAEQNVVSMWSDHPADFSTVLECRIRQLFCCRGNIFVSFLKRVLAGDYTVCPPKLPRWCGEYGVCDPDDRRTRAKTVAPTRYTYL